MAKQLNGYGALRSIIELARDEAWCSLGDLTVLSTAVDPYRLDTEAGHRDGKWLAQRMRKALGSTRRIHWRGLHYAIVAEGNVKKPDGSTYRNTDDDWYWLSEKAGKAARWLGYISFDRITDNRNAPPIIHRKSLVQPEKFVSVGFDVTIPDADELEPVPCASGFVARQRYHFAMFGEKASLEDVLDPIAEAKQADLYLPSGEISDTLIYRIAKDAAEDGRPLVLFTLADCDPAGYQMSVSIARKLQAFRDLLFPDLRFEVVPVALTVEQVRTLGLPSTPLKENEKRADRWREAFGIEQTEIDALATLQPDVLAQIVEDAFTPYWDGTLEARVDAAEQDWIGRATEALEEQIDREALDALRAEAAEKLVELQDAIDSLNERLRVAAGDQFDLPEIEIPEPELDEDITTQALVSIDDDWVEATQALIRRKAYEADR